MTRKGLALIVVIGILGILAVLAAAFVMMAQLERRASQQRVYAAKAYLLARSGIEDALARLELGQDPAYGGENWDGSADGLLSGYEADQEVYRRSGAGTAADTDTCPARQAMRSSFFVGGAAGNPAVLRVEGRDRGYSGRLGGDQAPLGNVYTLKVSSGQGFYINGGDPAAPPTEGYNAVLRRILGTLAEAIDRDVLPDGSVPSGDGKPVGRADGENLIDARPSTGWQNWAQMKNLALGGSQAKLDALRPYLALHAWVDRKVIAPNATAAMESRDYESWGQIKLDHARRSPPLLSTSTQYVYAGVHLGTLHGQTVEDPLGPESRISRAPDFERIHGNIVGRAPVDLAWARTRRPALIALLGGLQGLWLDESTARIVDARRTTLGTLRKAEMSLAWTPMDDCHAVADRILEGSGGIATWQAWGAFCDAVPDGLLNTSDPDLAQAKRDLLKANFNPNSGLNKFNPNASMWKLTDKSDLLVYSTEFNLSLSLGPGEVASAGRVAGADGRLLAHRTFSCTVTGSSLPVRLTTQQEFVCDDLGRLDLAGDERNFRLPSQAGRPSTPLTPPFISPNRGNGKTWGHALGLDDQGAALQTYPEPCVDTSGQGLLLSIGPADYDGNVQSATIETPQDVMYGAGAETRDMKMLARYTTGFDLAVADAFPGNPQGKQCLPGPQQVTYAGPRSAASRNMGGAAGSVIVSADAPPNYTELGYGLLHHSRPNTLYPDGGYAELARSPSYYDKGNANGFHGVMSFWFKSNHLFSRGKPPGRPIVQWTNLGGMTRFSASSSTDSGGTSKQFFFLSDAVDPGGTPLVVSHFEIGHATSDTNKEHQFRSGRSWVPHRFHLVTLRYDFQSLRADDSGALLLDTGLAPEDRGVRDVYGAGNEPVSAADITQDELREGAHRICLGKMSYALGDSRQDLIDSPGHPNAYDGMDYPVEQYLSWSADGTFDEFALYDFGGAEPSGDPAASSAALAAPSVLAQNRFREGRFYKESYYAGLGAPGNTAAEYFSAPILLPGGTARIKGLAWTQIVPRGLKTPLPASGQPGVDGDPAPDGAIRFELVDAAGTEYLQDISGRSISTLFTEDALSRVNRTVDRPFRLHAVFQPNLADPINTPILDPLALDDITVYYEPSGGPRIISWGDGE